MIEISGIDRDGVTEYRGLRFATAQRFAEPVDVVGWVPGTTAAAFGPQAPQVGGVLESLFASDNATMDEDCLFLNVFAPATTGTNRPVLVFVHGGAFMTGTGSMPWYDGTALASRGNAVVVTINYRLGALGFLGHHNLGSLDQISALRWVSRHIGDVGGDPNNVTIFGESAGGTSVVSLMAAPAADHLFHRAWTMSPSLLQLRDSDTADRFERAFLELIGPDVTRDALGALTIDEILELQQAMAPDAAMRNFSPASPSAVFPASALPTATTDERPLVIGTNRDEMLLFTTFDSNRSGWDERDVTRQFTIRFAGRAPDAIERYRRHRPEANASALVSAMQTDEAFRRPAQRLAEARCGGTSSTWMYTFDQPSTALGGAFGSCHGLDLPYAFHNLSAPGVETFTGPGKDRSVVADQFSSALLAFAHGGDPGWPVFDRARRATQRIGPVPDVVADPEAELREIWG